MQKQLSDAWIKFRVGSNEEAIERRVLEVLKLEDPDGNPVEIFHSPEVLERKPFHPGRPMHGRFQTGSGGLGHCIIRQGDVAAAYRFYSLLGMQGGVEYKIRMGQHIAEITFMHCNDASTLWPLYWRNDATAQSHHAAVDNLMMSDSRMISCASERSP